MASVLLIRNYSKSSTNKGDTCYKQWKRRIEADDPTKPAFAREVNSLLNISGLSPKRKDVGNGWMQIDPGKHSPIYWQIKIADFEEAELNQFVLSQDQSSKP